VLTKCADGLGAQLPVHHDQRLSQRMAVIFHVFFSRGGEVLTFSLTAAKSVPIFRPDTNISRFAIGSSTGYIEI
jgi:hypothetical protein